MEPNSDEHDRLAGMTPGTDEQERGMVECPSCGAEHEANRAAVLLKEEYTCPDCGESTTFNNHSGSVLLLIVLVLLAAPFVKAYLWLRRKLIGGAST